LPQHHEKLQTIAYVLKYTIVKRKPVLFSMIHVNANILLFDMYMYQNNLEKGTIIKITKNALK